MLSVEERLYTLSYLWKEADYNYAYWAMHPEIDWDNEYKKYIPQVINAKDDFEYLCLLKRFFATLQDGHACITFPDEIFSDYKFPLEFRGAEGTVYLIGVPSGQENHLFSRVVSINKKTVEQFFEEYVYPYFWHIKKDSVVNKNWPLWSSIIMSFRENPIIHIATENGKFDVSIYDERKMVNAEIELKPITKMTDIFEGDSCNIKITENDIGYIEISAFYSNTLAEDVKKHADELNKCKGIIIDVRNNRGGMGNPPYELACLFIDGKYPIKNESKTPGHNAQFRALEPYLEQDKIDSDEWHKKIYQVKTHTYYETDNDDSFVDFGTVETLFHQPVVVLCNTDTACAAEGFVDYFKMTKRAIVAGMTTYGSGSEAMIRDLPLGAKMWLGTTWSKLCDGSEYVNVGIKPDLELHNSLQDVRDGHDKMLDDAIGEMTK